MEQRLIDADKLVSTIKECMVGEQGDYLDGIADAVYCVTHAPTVDAKPVVHGEWIDKVNPQWRAYSHMQCSNCGWWNTKDATVVKGKIVLNFCPNCGADMRWNNG